MLLQADSNSYGGAMTYNGVVNYVAANGGSGSGGYELDGVYSEHNDGRTRQR